MRPMIQYGVPTVAGLGTSVRASREDENIGPVALAGAAGAAGGYGGLLAARQLGPGGMLAGKLAPLLSKAGEKVVAPTLLNYGRNRRGSNKVPKKAFMGERAERLGKALQDTAGTGTAELQEILADPSVARNFGIGAAAVTVPASALAAGLGGVAAGKAVGAFGIPGFVDPESYGSSNSPGARYKQTTMNYI